MDGWADSLGDEDALVHDVGPGLTTTPVHAMTMTAGKRPLQQSVGDRHTEVVVDGGWCMALLTMRTPAGEAPWMITERPMMLQDQA